MRLQVIGLAGRAGSGKNFLADQYFAPLGFRQVALADHMKAAFVGQGLSEYDEVFHHKTERSRTLLQDEGMRLRAHYGVDVWARILWTWMERWAETWGQTQYVITDIRFPNEIEYLQRQNALVYGIEAPRRVAAYATTMRPDHRAHVSEMSLAGGTHLYDGVIDNDPQHATTVGLQVAGLLRAHGFAGAR